MNGCVFTFEEVCSIYLPSLDVDKSQHIKHPLELQTGHVLCLAHLEQVVLKGRRQVGSVSEGTDFGQKKI